MPLLTSPSPALWISISPPAILAASLKFTLAGGVFFIFAWFFRLFILEPYRSHLSKLPGPPRVGIFGTHLPELLNPHLSARRHEVLRENYGLNLRIHGMGYFDERFLTFDPVAINYILGRAADVFPKPWQARSMIKRLIGDGVFVSEGDDHRRQRKVISPAFSPQALRALQPIFFSKAAQLKEAISQTLSASNSDSVLTNMNNWVWRTTFDIIGLAGFSYEFNSIQDENNEIYAAYRDLFQSGVSGGFTLKAVLEVWFPWIATVFPDDRNRRVKECKDTIQRVGEEVMRHKKEAIFLEKGVDETAKDMLTLLIKSNMAESCVQERLSDQELMTQISSLLFVGSDTTSLALTWTMYYLSLNPDVQDKLRCELAACMHAEFATESSLDEKATLCIPPPNTQQSILGLPYLEYIIKEALRLIPPLHSTLRVAEEDTYVPTSDGTTVLMRKGQFVHVAFEAFNTRKDVWGPDAHEFRPERWASLSPAAKDGPGLVQGLMSFSLGPHSCPGHQFSMLEMKAILAAIVPSFVFEPIGDEIKKGNLMMTRPFIKGDKTRTTRLPLRVRRYTPSS